MKSLFIALFVCFLNVVSAQGNLQFNEVKFIKMSYIVTTNVTNQYQEQTITVPAGKVWKIESCTSTFLAMSGTNPSYSDVGRMFLDKMQISNSGVNVLPIWLPAGTYTLRLVYNSNTSYSNSEVVGAISVIEFNVL